MVFSSNFVYLRAIGTLGNNGEGVEQWSAGMKIPMPTAPSASSLSAFLETVSVAYSAFHTDSGNGFGSTCFLKQLTAAYVGTDGKYVGGGAQSTTVYNYGTPQAGTGTGVLPFSTAVVLSLRTANSRGPASNGRVYWPKLAVPISPTLGTWAIGEGTAMAGKAANLINQINAACTSILGGGGFVSVMSQVGPRHAIVTSVRVGHKPDRQERREKKIAEAYGTAAVASVAGVLAERLNRPFDEL